LNRHKFLSAGEMAIAQGTCSSGGEPPGSADCPVPGAAVARPGSTIDVVFAGEGLEERTADAFE